MDVMSEANVLDLGHLPAVRKAGTEKFMLRGQPQNATLFDFWQWSVSDLISNATRGRLAEFIVAEALGIASGVRNEWDAYDLKSKKGLRIEVKSCGYLQSWKQTKLSTITWSVRKTRGWDATTNVMQKEAVRQSDLYIFALLAQKESKRTLDPLNLDQWEFYPIPTRDLDARQRSQHSITLRSLLGLCPAPLGFDELAIAVRNFERILIPDANGRAARNKTGGGSRPFSY
jgi:hypothetical protein